jgi:predicted PurR-regulated permease PerM
MLKPNGQELSFTLLVVLVSIAFILLLLPFHSAVLWAVILAVLFNPLQRWLTVRFGGRRTRAAAVSLLVCICVVVIPVTLVFGALAQEASGLYQSISTREFDPATLIQRAHARLPAFVLKLLEAADLGDFAALQERFTSALSQISGFVASRAVSIGQGTARFLIGLGVMLYVLFFLFRDGPQLAATIIRASPLSRGHSLHVMNKFGEVVKATVKGNFIIGILQGTVGGITFWALGIQAPLLWGVVMTVLSLLPAVGAFLVWAPVAIYLIVVGEYLRGAILIAVGALIISMVDNLLRPALVGKDLRLPDYMVLLSTLGGLSLFGMNGFVIGPLIAALFVAVWSLRADEHARPPSTTNGEGAT